MASLLSLIAPLIILSRGSKRQFRSAERTLARIQRQQDDPTPFAPPASIARTVTVTRREVRGWPVYELAPVTGTTHGRALYLHGGCYVFEIDPIHWAFAAKLAVEAGVRVTVPIMTLAPRATAAQTVPAVAALAQELIAEVGAERFSLLGDSAGGGMALAVAMVLRDQGVAPLHATVLISPWLDVSGTDPRLAELDARDPWLAVPGTRAAGELYRGALPDTDPMVNPIHGSLDGLGPLTMFSGTRDILNADATRLVDLAAATGHRLDYHEGKNMLHVYPLLPMPEGEAARKLIVAAVAA